MLGFWTREQRTEGESEIGRRIAALAAEINRSELRPDRLRAPLVCDITDLDEIMCQQLWPETGLGSRQ